MFVSCAVVIASVSLPTCSKLAYSDSPNQQFYKELEAHNPGFSTAMAMGMCPADSGSSALGKLTERQPEAQRAVTLVRAAKAALEADDLSVAKGLARKALAVVEEQPKSESKGAVRYYSHFVLGRVALAMGDTDAAIFHLLASKDTSESLEINESGPNMSLAYELLQRCATNQCVSSSRDAKRFGRPIRVV